MNIKTILHTFFEKSSFNAIKDQRRLNAVVDCSQALCNNETLTLTGVILEIIAQFFTFETIIPVVFTYGGFLAIALGLAIILLTSIVVMLPKVSKHLDACQH